MPDQGPKKAPSPIGLDLGKQDARVVLGNELELEAEGGNIELDYSAPEPLAAQHDGRKIARTTVATKTKGRRWPFVLIALLALGGGGAALERTEHGAFFRHTIDAFVHAEHRALLTQKTIGRVRDALGSDTIEAATTALSAAHDAVTEAPRHKPILGYAAYAFFAHELRFGNHADRHATAKEWLAAAGDHPNAHLAAAARHLVENDRAAARTALKKAPDGLEAKLLLGALEQAERHDKDAIAAYEQASKLETSPRTRAALIAALEIAEPKRALTMAKELARDAPDHRDARIVVGRLSIASGDLETAKTALAELEKLAGQATWYQQAETKTLGALVAIESGRWSDAQRLVRESLDISKRRTSPWTVIALGDLALHEGNARNAEAHYQAVLVTAGNVTRASLGLARALLAQGKTDEARKVLDGITDEAAAGQVAKLRASMASPAAKPKGPAPSGAK